MSRYESLLISSLLENKDVLSAESFGITANHFHGFRMEYEWIIDFRLRYKNNPSSIEFRTVFPDFPYNNTPSTIEYLVEEVKKNHIDNATAKLLRDSIAKIREGKEGHDVLAYLSGESLKIVKGIDVSHSIPDSMADMSESYDAVLSRLTGTSLGAGALFSHQTLQEQTNGLNEGDLAIKAARLGQGKSWSLVDDAVVNLLAGKTVIYFSLEMTRRQMEYRFQAAFAKRLGHDLSHTQIAHGKALDLLAYKALLADIEHQVPGHLFINDTTRGKVTPITVAASVNKYSPDLVVVDYLTLLGSSSSNRTMEGWQVVGSIVGELKEVATQFRVPILSAAQINREGDRGGWKPPRSVHLAQSDSIGQDADQIITMKRHSNGAMVYLLDKNRHGASGHVWFSRFDPDRGDLHEISKEQADEIKYHEGEYSDVD